MSELIIPHCREPIFGSVLIKTILYQLVGMIHLHGVLSGVLSTDRMSVDRTSRRPSCAVITRLTRMIHRGQHVVGLTAHGYSGVVETGVIHMRRSSRTRRLRRRVVDLKLVFFYV